MVVVRESPRAKIAPDSDASAAWPPASPLQALLSSPNGRKRWQDRQSRATDRTPSPSPMRRLLRSPAALSMPFQVGGNDDDEDEDEEMLRLKLERIEAQLKLKQLQKAKRREATEADKEVGSGLGIDRPALPPSISSSSPGASAKPRRSTVEVPASPKREYVPPQEQLSPARRRLGLDSGLKATSVSLKRARDGQMLRPDSRPKAHEAGTSTPKGLSFSERLARSKEESHEHQAKQDRIAQVRSAGFGARLSVNPSASQPSLAHDSARRGPQKSENGSSGPQVSRDAGPSGMSSLPQQANQQSTQQATTPSQPVGLGLFAAPSMKEIVSRPEPTKSGSDAGDAGFDPFSQLHLSKRHHAHVDVARELAGKEIYTLPRLLREVVAPNYDPPDCESDFVVFAVLASKSSPYDQKATHRTAGQERDDDNDAPRNKFMVLHLTDLKWEVDCFLFGTGFNQFWKLTPGTLLAILNPQIMPPKGNQHTGRFSLKLGSCDDMVMEIGVARDLGYCASKKKDGEQCGSWIDKRHAEMCEFHLNLFVEKNRKGRMEVNAMWRGHGDEASRHKSRSAEKGGFNHAINSRKGQSFHHEYGRLYAVPSSHAKSAANLLDAEDTDALHNRSREEMSRKRIAAAQRERDLAKRLGQLNDSIGAEYLRASDGASTPTTREVGSSEARAIFEKPSASELGLLGNRASDQRLSPAKDRRRHFGLGAVSSAGTDAMGWGGARTYGLLQPKLGRLGSPEKGQTSIEFARRSPDRARERSLSPRKRARFALDKGIREPGRDSLGDGVLELKGTAVDVDDDDDDLDIV